MNRSSSILILMFAALVGHMSAADPTNLHSLPSDLEVPRAIVASPAAGHRVKQTAPGYEAWNLFHTLYLPTDWQPPATSQRKYPVIVEYPGNGGYKNPLGDTCTGQVEDCNLGYGLSAGRRFIWLCLPFVNPAEKKHALNWWGDPDTTADYCVAAVETVCRDFGGDPSAVILTGFSRGAIAGNYIGLRNDRIAGLWAAMLPHSHYDGVRRWPYADSDADSAKVRLQRLGACPQFITHEGTIDATRDFLSANAPRGNFTFVAIPFPNHSDAWVLKDIPARDQARAWLDDVLKQRQR